MLLVLPHRTILKISLLRTYTSLYNFDVVCISETYLNFATTIDANNLEITVNGRSYI